MHSERCPVCSGWGKVGIKQKVSDPEPERTQACHGCGALGWVTVQDIEDLLTLRAVSASGRPAELSAVAGSAQPPSTGGGQVASAPAPHRIMLSPGLARRVLEERSKYAGRPCEGGYELTEIWIGNQCLMDPEAKGA
jgi:hypothetical protein